MQEMHNNLKMKKIVGDYVLMEKIGKGQYGDVYRAEHRTSGELFAVKVISLENFSHTFDLSEYANNEIDILTKINHPNIIRFIEMLATARKYYLVYEYCNGGTLEDYIKSKKRLPEDEAIKIFTQLRSAFELLTREKILHRNLKSTNILFHNGVVKVGDFGFYKEMMNYGMAQTVVGLPINMAPEILKGSIYDSRADIWSLGVIFYEMLYGFCPYEESSTTKLINLIENTVLKFPPEVAVSNHIKVLLKRMMTIKFRERISAAELIQSQTVKDLRELLLFNRKNITYMAETLYILANKLEEKNDNIALACFVIYKVLLSIQKYMLRSSHYWQYANMPNTDDQWDVTISNQMSILEPFRQHIKDIVLGLGNSCKLRMEMDASYVDFKYFLEIVLSFTDIDDLELRDRLVNCFLINRHYMLAFEKKVLDFTDYIESKKTLEEKEDVCKKFAHLRN